MKKYVKNVLCYLVALLGLLSFVAIFSSPLSIYDSILDRWSVYNVSAYLGETLNDVYISKGSFIPVIGFTAPLLMGITLIIESFHSSWGAKIKFLNTLLAIFFFISSLLVLLTKELFLFNNNLGDTVIIRNGAGPIFSAICSCLAGITLLITTYIPMKNNEIQFIE